MKEEKNIEPKYNDTKFRKREKIPTSDKNNNPEFPAPPDFPDRKPVSFFNTTLNSTSSIKSLDELLKRDKQRKKDGLPRKIRIGKVLKPGKNGQKKVIVVPTTIEEKLIHDKNFREPRQPSDSSGSGDGKEGEVIGEKPVQQGGGEGKGAGQGESGKHEVETEAYNLGKILTEQFELPNLKDKGKKKSLTKFTYELTDKNKNYGQLLDKKATLKEIIKTNIGLGNIAKINESKTEDLILSPADKVYRILSREKSYEAQAVVFFIRDYSASMSGQPTKKVVTQHIMIYSWLLYQYSGQVESRFILHDTEAKEVDDFNTYYNSQVAGGTRIASSYKKVNQIIADENLVDNYNIYIFQGTDGDDWDSKGEETVPELKKLLRRTNRIGITIVKNTYHKNKSEVEQYIEDSNLLQSHSDLLRLDVLPENAEEQRIIDGIKELTSE